MIKIMSEEQLAVIGAVQHEVIDEEVEQFCLINKRRYQFKNTAKEYVDEEYPKDDITIFIWLPGIDKWTYIDNSPNREYALNYLHAVSKLRELKPEDFI